MHAHKEKKLDKALLWCYSEAQAWTSGFSQPDERLAKGALTAWGRW